MKKNYIFILIFAFVFVGVTEHTFAASLSVVHVPQNVSQQEQFYVDIVLDPQTESINGIQGSLSFSNTLSFVRTETGSSIVTLWIDAPKVGVGEQSNTLSFSGVIPGGFDGTINPFDSKNKQPGEIVRLVFSGNAKGPATIALNQSAVTENDGAGTLKNLPGQTQVVTISNAVQPSVYGIADTVDPQLSATVVTDKNLYDGKYTLVVNALDKESGIDHIELKEGDGAFHSINSPYLLKDQSRQSILVVRAIDGAGNDTSVVINPTVSANNHLPLILFIIIVLVVFYAIRKKQKNKNT